MVSAAARAANSVVTALVLLFDSGWGSWL